MLFEEFKNQIKEANEQFNVVQTEGVTEVHWIYAGFDLYEEVKSKPQYREPAKEGIRGIFGKQEESEEVFGPKYHVLAKISEEREHVLELKLSASQIPERMRKAILPYVVDYTSTRLEDRTALNIPKKDPVIQSAKDLREKNKANTSLLSEKPKK